MTHFLVGAFLLAHLFVFWGYAVAWVGWPEALAARVGLSVLDADGMADLRAMYGGMCAGVGVIFAAALRLEAWQRPAVVLAIATSLGLCLSRLYSAAAFEMFGTMNAVFVMGELGSVVFGSFLLSQMREQVPPTEAPRP